VACRKSVRGADVFTTTGRQRQFEGKEALAVCACSGESFPSHKSTRKRGTLRPALVMLRQLHESRACNCKQGTQLVVVAQRAVSH
jgi:hypothetical protein